MAENSSAVRRTMVTNMTRRNLKDVSFTPEHVRFIEEQLRSGAYPSISDVVEAGLNLLIAQERLPKQPAVSETQLFEALLVDQSASEGVEHLRELIEAGLGQADEGMLLDGPAMMRGSRERLLALKAAQVPSTSSSDDSPKGSGQDENEAT